jgi:low affinity Fe/Cu permease
MQELKNIKLKYQLNNLEKTLKTKNTDIKEMRTRLDQALQNIQDFETIKKNTSILEENEKILKTSLSNLEDQINNKNKVIIQ